MKTELGYTERTFPQPQFPKMEDFAKVYRSRSDAELARLYYDVSSLGEPATAALAFEIRQRGLTPHVLATLSRLHAQSTVRVDKDPQQQGRETTRTVEQRKTVGFAMLLVGSLLVFGLTLLPSWNQTPHPQPAAVSQR
ncbi:MAG TPA: hypothetical protein VGI45_03105 [Terracidiphilus sp.]